jgi:hypothetical protein
MRSAGESLELTEWARPQSTLQNAKLRIRWKSARRDGQAVPRCHPEMTSLRSPDLQLFLTSAEAVIRHGPGVDGRVRVAAERMFAAL